MVMVEPLKKIIHFNIKLMSESNLNIALHAPIEELTDEQKALIRDSVAALSPEEVEIYTKAGVLEAVEKAPEVDDAGEGSATPPNSTGSEGAPVNP